MVWWTYSWLRHQTETFSALLALCAGNSLVPGEFPAERPVTRSFDVFFDLRPNKRLSKKSWGWWFETLSCSLWCHCNVPGPTGVFRTRDIADIPHQCRWPYVYGYGPCMPVSHISRRFNWLLTHWGRDKMAAFSQTTLSNAFFLMKILEFRLKIHWSLFLRVLLTIFQHWFW